MSRQTNQERNSASPFLLALAAGSLCSLWLSPSKGAEYQQKQGNAAICVETNKVEGGRVEIRLSDQIRLTVSVEDESTLEVQTPETLATSSDWQVRRESVPEKIPLGAGRVRWVQKFRLSPLKPGELSLSLAPVRFRRSLDADHWEEVAWRPIPVHVTTEIYSADLSELRDVAPPEELPPAPSWGASLAWAAAAIVFLLLLVAGWALWRRRRYPALPPSAWALRELARIQLPQESTEKGTDFYYTQLSDVLRKYLELRYHFPAPEQTTAEFLEAMRRSPRLQAEQQAVLRDFLEQCDLVKFARAQPSEEECLKAADIARTLVTETAACASVISAKPPEPPPDGQSARGTGCN